MQTTFTNDQIQYVERVTHPQTPEDIILALQNPHSAVFKTYLKLLNGNAAVDQMADSLLDQYLQSRDTDEKGKHEILEEFVSNTEIPDKIKKRYMEKLESMLSESSSILMQMDIVEFKKRLDARAHRIDALTQQSADLTQQLYDLQKQAVVNTREWKLEMKAEAEKFLSLLNEKHMKLLNKQGKEMSDDEIRNVFLSIPPAVYIIDMVSKTNPDFMQDNKSLCQLSHLIIQLKIFDNMHDAPAIANQIIKMQESLKKRESICEQALERKRKEFSLMQVMNTVNQELTDAKGIHKIEMNIFQQRTGQPFPWHPMPIVGDKLEK